jgi:hypothetical protein
LPDFRHPICGRRPLTLDKARIFEDWPDSTVVAVFNGWVGSCESVNFIPDTPVA